MKTVPNVSIIGTGALGSTLAKALYEQGISIKSVYNQSEEGLADLSVKVEAEQYGLFPGSVDELGTLVFITVPDDQIALVSNQLSSLSDSFKEYCMVHCSGNKPAEILKSLTEKGASTASFHPLQTFTANSDAEAFQDIYFDIQGEEEAVTLLGSFAEKLGAQWFEILAQAKPSLHAAAVMASNYLVALLKASTDIAELGGLNSGEVKQAMLPLVQESLRNASESNLSEALTGPIARGDIETVQEHLQMLEQSPDLLALYKQLGKKALELADIDKSIKKKFEDLFN